jgi:dienelactone hydrolase
MSKGTRRSCWSLVVLLVATSPLLAAGPADPSKDGPLAIREDSLTYVAADGSTQTLDLWLPAEKAGPRPTVLVVHGWGALGSQYVWIAKHLATLGFAAFVYHAPLNVDPDVTDWVNDVESAVNAIAFASAHTGSTFDGELDMSRFALVGHSYGGATSMGVAAIDTRVKTVVAFAPGTAPTSRADFLTSAKKVTVPLLVLSAEDEVVVPTELYGHPAWKAAPSAEKSWLLIKGAEHVNFSDVGFDFKLLNLDGEETISGAKQREIASRMATQWLERFLDVVPDPDGSAEVALVKAHESDFVEYSLVNPPMKTPDVSAPAPTAAARTGGLTGALPDEKK